MSRAAHWVGLFCLVLTGLPAYAETPYEKARDAYRAEHWKEATEALAEIREDYPTPALNQRAAFLQAVAQLKAGQAHQARTAFAALESSALSQAALFNAAVASVYEGKPEDSYAYLSKVPDSPQHRRAVLSLSALTAMQLKREALAVVLQARALNALTDAEYAKLATPAASARDFQAWTQTLNSALGAKRGAQVASLLNGIRRNPVELWSTEFDLPAPTEHAAGRGWYGGIALTGGSETYEQPYLESRTGPSLGVNAEAGLEMVDRWSIRVAAGFDLPLSSDLQIKFLQAEVGPTWNFYETKDMRLSVFLGYAILTSVGTSSAGYGYENSSGVQARLFGEFACGHDFIDGALGYSMHSTDAGFSASSGELTATGAYRWHQAFYKADLSVGAEFRQMTLKFSQGDVKHQTLSALVGVLLPE